jgi:hypothetical protein
MKLIDLRELYSDPSLPVTVKPFVHRELLERGTEPGTGGEEQVFEIGQEEIDEFDDRFMEQELEEDREGDRTDDGA